MNHALLGLPLAAAALSLALLPAAAPLQISHLKPPAQALHRAMLPGPRLLYVWDSTIPGNAAATTTLLSFAAAHEVSMLAIEASPVGYAQPGAVAKYAAFVAAAHGAGVQVLALNGYAWFTVSCSAGVPGQPTCFTEGWGVYQTIALSGVPFDGILDDSEPHATDYTVSGVPHNHFFEALPGAAQDYLDWLHGVRARIGALPFYSVVPYWFDEDPALNLALDGEPAPHPLEWYVARIVDVVNVLDYRDHAAGPGGMLEHATGELATGPCLIGVETADTGTDSETFWEEGSAYMEQQLGQFFVAEHTDPDFRGLSISHYGSWAALGP